MTVWLNGNFLPKSEAAIPVNDRGFQYGDGIFETLEVRRGTPFLWHEHFSRFQDGARWLRLPLPLQEPELLHIVQELPERCGYDSAIVRITLTRGPGPRGYSPRGSGPPTLLLMAFPFPSLGTGPAEWNLMVSSHRLLVDSGFGSCKSTNKLLQVLAKAEADESGARDALLLNVRGEISECTGANLFWIKDDSLFTPGLDSGCLPGITRHWVLSQARSMGIETFEVSAVVEALLNSDGVFATHTGAGIAVITRIDKAEVRRHELPFKLWHQYHELMH